MLVHTDYLHRVAYATDASAYREMPLAVAYPQNEDDIRQLLQEARSRHTHLIPRAGGTSIAGQVVGNGIVVDISRHFNHIIEINAQERWAWIEPGVVRDELNLHLQPYGLFFSPETSTSNRCCIGGMVGNNSCGTHSLIYGSTRHHLLEVRGLLSDGTPFSTASREGSPLWQQIWQQIDTWAADPRVRQLLSDNFPDPSLRRRSCGYAIDEAVASRDLCKLICGSEGTLCFITAVKVSLDPLPPAEKMLLCAHCDTLSLSYQANLVALNHQPAAVELMDGKILELCRDNPSQRHNLALIQDGSSPKPVAPAQHGSRPNSQFSTLNSQLKKTSGALIIAEFQGPDMDSRADSLEKELLEKGLAYRCIRVYSNDINRVWALRKAGLGVLSGTKSDSKPVGVIEDTAVAPERLPQYLDDFEKLMQRLGLQCVYYGHISTGELHLRPILNLKDTHDRQLFRTVAYETALLVRKHHGSLSGEHGDGRLRGEFIPLLYGDEVYQLMREVKKCWDPDSLFNMNKIVDTPPMDEYLRYDIDQTYRLDDKELLCAIEQCNGAADCRKSNLIGGTMCPTFKVSHDELRSTRARANILREVLTRGLPDGKDREALEEMLYSCLACKGCKSECPSNIDMTRIRAQVLQHLYDQHGTPFRSWMVARMASVERLGRLVRPLYNYFASAPWSSAIIKKLVSFAPERSIPTLSKKTTRQLIENMKNAPWSFDSEAENNPRIENGLTHNGSSPKCHGGMPQFSILNSQLKKTVYLFADEFTNMQEADLGLRFAQLLTALGYHVVVPRHVESGRAAISKGCLHLAARYAERNVRLLKGLITDETPLVGIEPSCILSFRDEYPDLVPAELKSDAQKLAQNCLLYDEFIMREVARGHISPQQFSSAPLEVWLHGHCHQKALVGIEKTAAMLRLLPGCKLHVIPSSCCGMAGSFGYEAEHYKTSLAIGEMLLFPTIREAVKRYELSVKNKSLINTPSHLKQTESPSQDETQESSLENGIPVLTLNAALLTETPPTFVAAPGTSCRQQILDGTGVHALHPIEIMLRYLAHEV